MRNSYANNEFSHSSLNSKLNLKIQTLKSLLSVFIVFLFFAFSPQIVNGQINYSNGLNSSSLPAGWSTSGYFSTTTTPCEGTYAFRNNLYAFSTYGFIKSNSLGNTSGYDIEIKYDYKLIDWSGGGATSGDFGSIYFEYSVDNEVTWDTLTVIDSSNHVPSTSCVTIIDTIPSTVATSGNSLIIRYAGSYGTAGDYYVYFDNFSAFELTPCYTMPVGIDSLSNTTLTSTDVNVTLGASNKYDLAFGASGFNPATAGTIINSISTSTYNLTGLGCADYDIYVRDSCNMVWVGPASITYPVPSLDSITNYTQNSFQLNVTLGGSGAYDIQYGLQGYTLNDSTATLFSGVTSNNFVVSNLMPTCGDYDVYFQDTCQKVWNGPFTINLPKPTIDSITNITTSSATINITAGISGVYNSE